ncbi:MAG: FeoB-associated Cys-rich membrane protein [Lachnospiraceae bacterium]|nr:FeoB-associated Cys-rich membrane protein [Lachnospiraceae bacterium]
MIDIILILMVAAAVGAALAYIIKEKKKGTVCIGCPSAGTCSKKNRGECGCQNNE